MQNLLIIVMAIAGVWGLFLLPSFIESRREAPLTSTERYGQVSQRLSQVQSGNRSGVSDLTLARRRRVLIFTSSLAIATLAFAVVTSNIGALVAHLVVDAFIAWYLAMIVQLRNQQQAHALRAHSAATVDRFDEVRVIAG